MSFFPILSLPTDSLAPFPIKKNSFLTRIRLRRENDFYYISSQEDFYHPDDFTSLIMPPLVPVVQFVMDSASTISAVNAKLAAGVLGLWKVGAGAGRSAGASVGMNGGEGRWVWGKKD